MTRTGTRLLKSGWNRNFRIEIISVLSIVILRVFITYFYNACNSWVYFCLFNTSKSLILSNAWVMSTRTIKADNPQIFQLSASRWILRPVDLLRLSPSCSSRIPIWPQVRSLLWVPTYKFAGFYLLSIGNTSILSVSSESTGNYHNFPDLSNILK